MSHTRPRQSVGASRALPGPAPHHSTRPRVSSTACRGPTGNRRMNHILHLAAIVPAELDEAGWTTDSAGEPTQDQWACYRARATCAVRDARAVRERPEAAADSVTSVMAIGFTAVQPILA